MVIVPQRITIPGRLSIDTPQVIDFPGAEN